MKLTKRLSRMRAPMLWEKIFGLNLRGKIPGARIDNLSISLFVGNVGTPPRKSAIAHHYASGLGQHREIFHLRIAIDEIKRIIS